MTMQRGTRAPYRGPTAPRGAEIGERWVELLHGEVPSDPRPMQIIQVELKAKLEFIEDFISLELSDIQEEAENAQPVTDQRSERVSRARAG